MKTKSLINKLGRKFPKKIAKKYYDFPGLQINKLKENTNNILLCLDFDETVYNYIINNHLENEIDLIITHHPFIFGKKKYVLLNNPYKLDLYNKMLVLNIPIYSFHTNFDECKDGMNDALANELELINIKSLDLDPMARGGELKEELDVYDFVKYVKNKFNCPHALLLNYGTKNIKKVAIVGGAGWSTFKKAQLEGYDIFISGDIPHHGRRDVISYHYNYLDLPHEIERIFIKQMKNILLEIDNTLNIICVDHEEYPKII